MLQILEDASIGELRLSADYTVDDVNRQLAYVGKKVPYRGEMSLYKKSDGGVGLMAYGFLESHSTWIAAGVGVGGLLLGYLLGRRRR